MIAIAVLAYNRVDLLRQCVENVLLRTSDATQEILIWDNASTDGTAAYLDSLTDPRISVVHHPRNIGLNAFAQALPRTSADHIVTLDEDVIDAPPEWDRTLLEAFLRLPDVGFLATSQVDDERSECATIMHHRDRHLYTRHEVGGVRLLEGPVGGWCAMTSRSVHDRAGGFPVNKKHVFFHHDEAYIKAIAPLGYRAAILEDLEVFHASGPHYSRILDEKGAYLAWYSRTATRKKTIKRLLLAIPFARPLNARYRWFEPPQDPR